ncbi:hypothetical protein BDA99DRAFT_541083 [Phascolomyces articulosus]|uniref:Uncharacterized protein n=1 Tax=Phascolomyces articulosus TaxID=60185 RepID=A0AAD5JSI5_9FUNG|nr:hypothetical protein BDA99DRAFT_541083 [Phascolomyces articulosus]
MLMILYGNHSFPNVKCKKLVPKVSLFCRLYFLLLVIFCIHVEVLSKILSATISKKIKTKKLWIILLVILKNSHHLILTNSLIRMTNGPSEFDFVVRIWSQLDKCLDNLVYIKRDNSCLANLVRLNNERRVDGKKPVAEQVKSSRPDLLLMKDNVEFWVDECGKMDVAVSNTGNDLEFARNFQVVGFSHTCFRMSRNIMDCPGGVVCRLRKPEEYEIPRHASLFCTGIIPIIELMLMAKCRIDGCDESCITYGGICKQESIFETRI